MVCVQASTSVGATLAQPAGKLRVAFAAPRRLTHPSLPSRRCLARSWPACWVSPWAGQTCRCGVGGGSFHPLLPPPPASSCPPCQACCRGWPHRRPAVPSASCPLVRLQGLSDLTRARLSLRLVNDDLKAGRIDEQTLLELQRLGECDIGMWADAALVVPPPGLLMNVRGRGVGAEGRDAGGLPAALAQCGAARLAPLTCASPPARLAPCPLSTHRSRRRWR